MGINVFSLENATEYFVHVNVITEHKLLEEINLRQKSILKH